MKSGSEELFYEKLKFSIQQKMGAGSYANWTHKDFLNLSSLIRDKTNETVGVNTLKRFFGKIRFAGHQNANTLQILCEFAEIDIEVTYPLSKQSIESPETYNLGVKNEKRLLIGVMIGSLLIGLIAWQILEQIALK